MSTSNYPAFWPKPKPKQPKLVQTRITDEQKWQLYHRRITTRELAKQLDCGEAYLSYLFPGKVPIKNRSELVKARKAYKITLAMEVLHGKYTVREAAEVACTSYSTMIRNVELAKQLHPALAQKYDEAERRYKRKVKDV